ncbi:MAG: hypothetical protein BWY54_00228 [Candidatus Dependentiae bacterium ADurb.Bin331]|nr:MAG: hypothetical protein BWY54_00228 [Candidatus Dependentiae bacterium ADurb.Bin331]
MVVSMTGFALKNLELSKADGSTVQLTMSIKSLNSRFFETTCKFPLALQYLELEFIRKLKDRLLRGHVTIIIHAQNPHSFRGPIQAEPTIAASYLNAINAIKKNTGVAGEVQLHDLIGLPNVFSFEEQTADESFRAPILKALDQLINELIKVRVAEGKNLLRDLEQRFEVITKEMSALEKEAHQLMEDRKAKITARMGTIDQHNQELAESQRNTLYFELDKIDIHEEIIRFKSHLATFNKTIHLDENEKGRRLDFILQEMAREINTITAKCSDAHISAHAINIKVELEKAREQVQNIV